MALFTSGAPVGRRHKCEWRYAGWICVAFGCEDVWLHGGTEVYDSTPPTAVAEEIQHEYCQRQDDND
jgi:hypothetical protein